MGPDALDVAEADVRPANLEWFFAVLEVVLLGAFLPGESVAVMEDYSYINS